MKKAFLILGAFFLMSTFCFAQSSQEIAEETDGQAVDLNLCIGAQLAGLRDLVSQIEAGRALCNRGTALGDSRRSKKQEAGKRQGRGLEHGRMSPGFAGP